jgi:hypothetical protein
MKRKLLLAVSVLAFTAFIHASDGYWIDVNFTRDSTMWKEAFPPLAVSGLNLQSTPSPNGQYLEYGLDGAFGRFAVSNYNYTPFNTDNIAEQFIYAIRLHNNSTSYWSFPGTSDVGKVKLNLLCGNATLNAEIYLQKYVSGEGAETVWADFDPVVKFEVPPHAFSTSSFVLEKELNLTEPTKLRLKGPTLRNVHIYAMSISKNTSSSVENQWINNINIRIDNRTVEIDEKNNNSLVTIYNISGIKVGSFHTDSKFEFPAAGIYLLEIENYQGKITKKINIF